MQQLLNLFVLMIQLINIVEKFKNDSVDFHQTVADMADISRTQMLKQLT
jgi:hypothetical protein